MTLPASSRSGKKTSKLSIPASISLRIVPVGQLLIGLDSTSPVSMSITSAAT